jgi:hypothetical protein
MFISYLILKLKGFKVHSAFLTLKMDMLSVVTYNFRTQSLHVKYLQSTQAPSFTPQVTIIENELTDTGLMAAIR